MMTTELLRLHVNSLERSLREQRSTAVTEVVQAYRDGIFDERVGTIRCLKLILDIAQRDEIRDRNRLVPYEEEGNLNAQNIEA